jgi:hypothetical protein
VSLPSLSPRMIFAAIVDEFRIRLNHRGQSREIIPFPPVYKANLSPIMRGYG